MESPEYVTLVVVKLPPAILPVAANCPAVTKLPPVMLPVKVAVVEPAMAPVAVTAAVFIAPAVVMLPPVIFHVAVIVVPAVRLVPVSYTHLTLPTKREV